MNSSWKPKLEIAVGGAFFGFIPILIRSIEGIDVFTIAFFRMVIASLIFLCLLKHIPKLPNVRHLACLSLFNLGLIFSYFQSIQLVPMATAVLLLKSLSFWTILFSIILLRERIRKETWLALIFGFTGIFLILGGSFEGSLPGLALGLMSGVFAALFFISFVLFFQQEDLLSLLFYLTLTTSLLSLPIVEIPPVPILITNFPKLVALSVLGTVFPGILILHGSQQVPGQLIGVLQNSELILPVFLGILMFGEIPTLEVVLGGLLILLSYIPLSVR